MPMPDHPVTLTPDQISELNRKLIEMRHDINNNLSLIVATIELLRVKPQAGERMMSTLMEQPGKITQSVRKFSQEFEKAFGVSRG